MNVPFARTYDRRLRITDGAGSVAGVELEYWESGAGEPVVFLHGGILADWFGPLAEELSERGGYRLVSYHRPGYGTSAVLPQPITMAGQAECCLALMRHLGLVKAHLVGHSIGACIALQAALQEPEAVASLALLEPPVMTATTDPSPVLTVLSASTVKTSGAWVGWIMGRLFCNGRYWYPLLTLLRGARLNSNFVLGTGWWAENGA